MTQEELNQVRDELALKACQQIEPAITRDMVSRGQARVCANEGFKAGFDAAVSILQKENEQLKAELDQCKIDQIEFFTQHPTYKLSKQLEAENKRLNEMLIMVNKMAIASLEEIGSKYGVIRNPKY